MSAGTAFIERAPWLRGRFARDTSTLVVGLVGAQAITLAAAPVLTRIYSPSEFGAFAAFSALVGTFSIVACLVYEPAIVLPEAEQDAATVLLLCLLTTTILSGVLALGVYLFGPQLARLLRFDGSNTWLWWVPVNLVLIGQYQAFNYWSTRHRHFGNMSFSRVGQAAATAAIQMAGGGVGGLIGGVVGGQIVASGVLMARDLRAAVVLWRQGGSSLRSVAAAAYEYRRFPVYSSWGTFMNGAAFQVVPLVLARTFGAAVAGWYFLGFRLASVPMSFVGTALGQVVLQRSAEQLARGERIGALVERVVGKSLLVGLPPFAGLAVVAPSLFAAVFGEQWRTSGVLLRVLVPLFFVQFLVSPVSSVLYSMQRQDVVAWIQAALFFGAAGSLLLGAHVSQSPVMCLALYSGVQSILYLVYLAALLRCAGASPRRIVAEALTYR